MRRVLRLECFRLRDERRDLRERRALVVVGASRALRAAILGRARPAARGRGRAAELDEGGARGAGLRSRCT